MGRLAIQAVLTIQQTSMAVLQGRGVKNRRVLLTNSWIVIQETENKLMVSRYCATIVTRCWPRGSITVLGPARASFASTPSISADLGARVRIAKAREELS